MEQGQTGWDGGQMTTTGPQAQGPRLRSGCERGGLPLVGVGGHLALAVLWSSPALGHTRGDTALPRAVGQGHMIHSEQWTRMEVTRVTSGPKPLIDDRPSLSPAAVTKEVSCSRWHSNKASEPLSS